MKRSASRFQSSCRSCGGIVTRLTDLSLGRRTLADKDLAELLTASTTGWRSLGLGTVDTVGPLSVAKILESAPTLQNLWVDGSSAFTSKAIKHLLENAPHLARFCATNLRYRDPYVQKTTILRVEDFLSSDWACRDSLEVLDVELRGVPRPTRSETPGKQIFSQYESVGDVNKSHGGVRLEMVYERLGQLKNLRELILGLEVDVGGCSRDFLGDGNIFSVPFDSTVFGHFLPYHDLKVSLNNGLDQLQSLKELRRVRLPGMAVRFINTDERAWAKKAWPKLEQAGRDDFWKDRAQVSSIFEFTAQ